MPIREKRKLNGVRKQVETTFQQLETITYLKKTIRNPILAAPILPKNGEKPSCMKVLRFADLVEAVAKTKGRAQSKSKISLSLSVD